jgi:CO/xanthine dehydrogenase FAD-binding subunit
VKGFQAISVDVLASFAFSNRSSLQPQRWSSQHMRGDPEAHEFVAPGSLAAVLELMADAPGKWTPIAGGTELMVAHAAGRLPASKLVSLWGIPDLRFIDCTPTTISIGAGATFTDMRTHAAIASDLILLARAASWIGSIANQTRATLGGNLVNGSPAADSSPALLAYDAEVEFMSIRGRRRIAYSAFHTGYKTNALAPDELLYAIHVSRRFKNHQQYIRKVGTRRAMAIAKVALAGAALLQDGIVREIRLAAASLAPFPARLNRAENVICGEAVDPDVIQAARSALLAEVRPIDDIRSSAEYRSQVAANLLEEFLGTIGAPQTTQ